MMRRSSRRLVNVVDILNAVAANQRVEAAQRPPPAPPTGTKYEQNTMNPISNMMAIERHLKGSKFHEDVDVHKAATPADLRRWMDVKHAARILGIDRQNLIQVKPDEVKEAVERVLGTAQSRVERREAGIAAEVLYDYIESNLHRATTMEHYRKVLKNASLDVDETLDRDKDVYRTWGYWFLGFGFVTVFLLFGFGGFIMFHFFARNDADRIANAVKASLIGSLFQERNDEPTPNYQQRYPRTPTEAELYQTDMGDCSRRVERVAEKYVEEVTRSDQAFLTEIYLAHQKELQSPTPAGEVPTPKLLREATTADLVQATMNTFPSPMQRIALREDEKEALKIAPSAVGAVSEVERIL